MSAPIVHFENVRKTYQMGPVTVEALRGVTFEIQAGEYISIMGPSGCGKSTMLNLLGCLDRPSSGHYRLGGEDVSQMNDDALSAVRGARLGFVFQSYNLIQQLTVVENIEIPLYYQDRPEQQSRDMAPVFPQLVSRASVFGCLTKMLRPGGDRSLVRIFLFALPGGDGIGTGKPAVQVDIAAALGAERPRSRDGRFAADWARPRRLA